MEDITLDSLKNNNYPFQDYIALNRFITWVKQVRIMGCSTMVFEHIFSISLLPLQSREK